MPFSFKPEISQSAPSGSAELPASPLGISPANLMERAKSEGKTFVEIALFALFGLSMLAIVALFVYKYYLTSRIEAKKGKINSYESLLAGMPLEEMRNTSNRLKVVSQLIKEHPSVNVAFMILEASVENMITYNKFELQYSNTSKSYQLSLEGRAPDYKSVAQQTDTYQRKPYSTYVSKIAVDGLQPTQNGGVSFNYKMPISIMGFIPETFSIVDPSVAAPAVDASAPGEESAQAALPGVAPAPLPQQNP